MDRPETYCCYGLQLRSDIALPELIVTKGKDPTEPVVFVRRGTVPDLLPGAIDAGYGLQLDGGDALLTVPRTARYLIRNGQEIMVDPLTDASGRAVRLFLLGSALGILCHQRGLLPLHANAIRVGAGAVAFSGPSGAGKSTLAAHFQRRGYPVLCDDVCVTSFDGAGTAIAWPGPPRLKLRAEAASAFGYQQATLEPGIEGEDKYHLPIAPTAIADPAPLRRLYLLARAGEGEPAGIVLRTGGAALEAVMANTYRGMHLAPMGLAERHFRQCLALLAQVEVYTFTRDWGYDRFEHEAAAVEAHLSELND